MTDKFIIEKNIPNPTPMQYGGLQGVFERLKVGDSVWVGKSNTQLSGYTNKCRKLGKKFTTRTEVKDGVKGCRVWRIA
jgi:hypothetical protein